jgi:hypothetical protein
MPCTEGAMEESAEEEERAGGGVTAPRPSGLSLERVAGAVRERPRLAGVVALGLEAEARLLEDRLLTGLLLVDLAGGRDWIVFLAAAGSGAAAGCGVAAAGLTVLDEPAGLVVVPGGVVWGAFTTLNWVAESFFSTTGGFIVTGGSPEPLGSVPLWIAG